MGGETTKNILMVAFKKSSWCFWLPSWSLELLPAAAAWWWCCGCCCGGDFLLTLRLMLPTNLRQSCPPKAEAMLWLPPPSPCRYCCWLSWWLSNSGSADGGDDAVTTTDFPDDVGLASRSLARRLRLEARSTDDDNGGWPPLERLADTVMLPIRFCSSALGADWFDSVLVLLLFGLLLLLLPLNRRTRLRKVPLRDCGAEFGDSLLRQGSTLSNLWSLTPSRHYFLFFIVLLVVLLLYHHHHHHHLSLQDIFYLLIYYFFFFINLIFQFINVVFLVMVQYSW